MGGHIPGLSVGVKYVNLITNVVLVVAADEGHHTIVVD